jgi:hypothetical protein
MNCADDQGAVVPGPESAVVCISDCPAVPPHERTSGSTQVRVTPADRTRC